MTPPVRLTSLTLEKYGPFENRILNFRNDAALHIVFGRNEAGKSVTLRAVADLICGFPARIDSDDCRVVRFKSGDLRLAATMLHADGRTFSFRRRAGRQNTLLGATDNDKCDEATFRHFTGLPERKDFESEFGLTAEALRNGGQALLAAGGRLAETLAAGSAHLSVLNKVRSQLQDEAATLYLPRHKKQINEVVDRYLKASSQFRAAVVTGEALKDARKLLDEAEARRAQINERHRDMERRRALLERARRTRDKLRQRAQALARLADFSTLPEIAKTPFDAGSKACEREASRAQEIAGAQAKLEDFENQAKGLNPSPGLLAAAGEIEKLVEALGAADKSRGDLPRREEALRAGLQKLQQAARGLGLADANALIERMPNDLALTRVRELLRRRTALQAARESAKGRVEKAHIRRRALDQSGAQRVDDPTPLLNSFASFADISALAKSLRDQGASLHEQSARLALEAQRLTPSVQLDELLRAPLPDVAVIETQLRRATALDELERESERDEKALAKRISETQKLLRDLARQGDISSPEDMRNARHQRDVIIDTMEVQPEPDPRERTLRFAGLRSAIADADRQADNLLGGADRAARQRQLSDTLAQAQIESAGLTEVRAECAQQRAVFDEDWRALWSGCGFAPLPPALMRDWRMKAAALVERHDNLSGVRAAYKAASAECSERAARLRVFAQLAGVQADGEAPVAEVYNHVRIALEAVQKTWSDGRQREADLASAANEIAEAEKEITELDDRDAQAARDWRESLATLALGADGGVAEAEEALRIWAAAIGDLRDYRDDDHRVTTIRRDIESFEMRVGDMCGRFCPDMAGETPRRVVETLIKRRDEARAAATKLEQLAKQKDQAARDADALRKQISLARDAIATAATTLGLSEESLSAALPQIAERLELMEVNKSLYRDIAAAGDGLTPEQLEAEQGEMDFDALPAELAEISAQKNAVLDDLQGAAIASEAARKALGELEAGRDAPSRILEQKQAASELLDITRDWLLRMGAAKLAGVAMEQHRRRNQDPVIAAASGLFAHATGGAFSGVVIDLDDDGQPLLKGARRDGARLATEAMSEGTRDQLFLALRLALLGQRSADPMPFIGDDLLASFDDERTAHTIEMMSEFGSQRQTILFTHHGHVVEAARARLGARVDVVDLGL
ncbi:MAG: AAA family ATPase [Beijerinckiaceae bacterium]|nr:AAA family ATPase [Beijerinckiaceae bacterium]